MKAFISTAALAATLLGATVAQAAVGVTLKAGTLGGGGDLTVGLHERFNVRLGVSGMSVSYDFSGDKEKDHVGKITPTLKFLSAAALLDVHPWANGFRITGGICLNDNHLDLTADTSQTVEINGREYRLGDLKGSATFKRFAPYAGLGYGNAAGANGRWHFAFDLGALFQGAANVELRATVDDPGLEMQLNADLEEEAKKIEDDVAIYKVYPVVSLGVSFRF